MECWTIILRIFKMEVLFLEIKYILWCMWSCIKPCRQIVCNNKWRTLHDTRTSVHSWLLHMPHVSTTALWQRVPVVVQMFTLPFAHICTTVIKITWTTGALCGLASFLRPTAVPVPFVVICRIVRIVQWCESSILSRAWLWTWVWTCQRWWNVISVT